MNADPIVRLIRLIGLLLLIACSIYTIASLFSIPTTYFDGGGFDGFIAFSGHNAALFEIKTASQAPNGTPFALSIRACHALL
jgi:hypothetical protein